MRPDLIRRDRFLRRPCGRCRRGRRGPRLDHGLGEIVNALIEAGPGIESLVEHPFLDWGVDFLTKAPDGTFRLPEGTAGDSPLMFSIRAKKPLD